ncbi:hypothetical protein Egran_02082 [Elaphomyces granulatus]|uniref:Carboxymuconolactone decarboxylase-like domain-containing protein n=1 Tax=Elaphomyces granulatus TaxID=519963 RepID=A0A232M1C1_9EURO|nr:hypothetical protein Egran_02082 [Elaphomyces granulatus]
MVNKGRKLGAINSKAMATSNHKGKSLHELCSEAKSLLPQRFRPDAWYIVVASTLVASGKAGELGALYKYITEEESPGLGDEEMRRLKARLGDVLMKEWTLVGITPVVIAVTALGGAEKGVKVSDEENMTFPQRRQSIDFNHAIPERGTRFIQQLYRDNLAPIFSTWGSYGPDLAWVERAVIYGLFLSDHEILSVVEAELVILSAIMCQGYRMPTIWHLRGLRRLGVSEDDVEKVQSTIEAVAIWAGKSIDGWPRVTDVTDEV